VEVSLKFHNGGFMVMSTPSYNDGWTIHVDPSDPFNKLSETYGQSPSYPFLDYDGFRAGPFQRETGWCVSQHDLLSWQRDKLGTLGFTEAEIDDVNYTYGRHLLERRYPESHFAVYPQEKKIVDASVSLKVDPTPDTVHRLWLYFVPVKEPVSLPEPVIPRLTRNGFTAVELGYLTDHEIPAEVRNRGRFRATNPTSMLGSIRIKSLPVKGRG
jgi:hypothetical protein